MSFIGITYDNQGPTAQDHGAFYRALCSDGILDGCAVSYLGNAVTIAAGRFVSAGRIGRLAAAEPITIEGSSGVARIVLQTDLAQQAAVGTFEQLSFVVQTAASMGELPALVREDINSGGVLYQMMMCVVSLGDAGITGVLATAPQAGSTALYSPRKWCSDATTALTAEYIGTTIGLSGSNAPHALLITKEVSDTLPIGFEAAVLFWTGTSASVVFSGGVEVGIPGEGFITDPTLSLPEQFTMIAIKKMNSNGQWLVTGNVEVV